MCGLAPRKLEVALANHLVLGAVAAIFQKAAIAAQHSVGGAILPEDTLRNRVHDQAQHVFASPQNVALVVIGLYLCLEVRDLGAQPGHLIGVSHAA